MPSLLRGKLSSVDVGAAGRAAGRRLRRHWIVNSFVQATAIGLGLYIGELLSDSVNWAGPIAGFALVLGVNLFIRGWWAPDRSRATP